MRAAQPIDERVARVAARVQAKVGSRTPVAQLARGANETAASFRRQASVTSDEVLARLDAWEDPARRAGVGVLRAAQNVVAVVFALPALVVRALGVAREIADRADDVTARSHDAAERMRDLVHRIEPSARARRRRGAVIAGSVGLGFGVGVVAGMLIERRCAANRAHQAGQSLSQHAADVAGVDAPDDVRSLRVASGAELPPRNHG